MLRNGKWNEEDAAILVPGDVISIKLGDIIPADARLLEGDPLKIDQVFFYYYDGHVHFVADSLIHTYAYSFDLLINYYNWLILQSALTGESLPVTKQPGEGVYSGSTCKQGEIEAVVIATGVHTFFGKAAHLVDSTNQVGHFQKVRNKVHLLFILISVGM